MTYFTSKLTSGRPPDPQLVNTIVPLFRDEATEHELAYLISNDKFSRALTGNRAVDLWRAWRDARLFFVKGQPMNAFRRLKSSAEIHPIADIDQGGLPDIERDALFAECVLEGNQPLDAYRVCERVRERLLRFACLIQDNPEMAANDIREMLEQVCGGIQLRRDLNDQDLIGAWTIGRGVPLLLIGAVQMSNLSYAMGLPEDVKRVVTRTTDDIIAFHTAVGCAFDPGLLVQIDFTLGNCWTEVDPELALEHFDNIIRLRGLESGQGMQAMANAANCLLRLHRYGEARSRYSAIEGLFEMNRDYLGAARVWTAECIAEWHETGDSSLRHNLVGAIKLFEENLPDSADSMTHYTFKKYMEPAYLLLIAILSESKDYSDDRINELLAVSWALLSRDFKAHLESGSTETGWQAVLASQQRPLSIAKTVLAPFRGTGVVHLFSVPDRLEAAEHKNLPPSYQAERLVWIIYGYDAAGKFRFEVSMSRAEDSTDIFHFLDVMEEQLSADVLRDSIQIQNSENELMRLANQISQKLSAPFIQTLLAMDHLYYVPRPFGSIEEFPLGALRFNGEWLGTRCIITRSPTINHLREILNPNRPVFQGNRRAVIVAGEPSSGGRMLQGTPDEIERVSYMLKLYGFDCQRAVRADSDLVRSWLDGGAGILHYIGHGIANNVYEGLPLTSNDMFRALDLDYLTGFKTPFVFLCACEAARIRHGAGGYQIGLASKLVERGAPAVVAFSMPIPETRAFEIVRIFYRQAFRRPFGVAVRDSQKELIQQLPAYAWLALSAYGDPNLRLPAMVNNEHVPMSADRAHTWHSHLRSYAVLRTEPARQLMWNELSSVPTQLRSLVREFLASAFLDPSCSSDGVLDRLEEKSLSVLRDSGVGLLSIRAAICLERAHRIGLDANPIRWPEPGDATRRLLYELHFVAVLGVTLFDTRLNGLGCALMGRLITWDQGNLDHSAVFLQQGIEKLKECASLSPYVRRIVDESISIVQQFGGVSNL